MSRREEIEQKINMLRKEADAVAEDIAALECDLWTKDGILGDIDLDIEDLEFELSLIDGSDENEEAE